MPFPTSSAAKNQHNIRKRIDPTSQDTIRLGTATLYTFFVTSVVILGGAGFLSFLWFGDYTNKSWREIMIRNWVTRAVSISALFLRTAVDFQAAVATAMLVSLLLESRTGIQLYHLADLSSMRNGAANPWSLAWLMVQEAWRSSKTYRKNLGWALMATGLLISTSILQFSSTVLLSDLKPGPLGGHDFETQIRNGLSYRNITRRITRDSAWTSNPPLYPAFGEYTETLTPTDGVSDTGILLRSFLPYATAESRESLRSYAGKAMVLDARVSCQAPRLTHVLSEGHYAQVNGTAGITHGIRMLQYISAVDFACSIAGLNEYSICQLGRTFPAYVGSLNSQFEKSSSYGTAFLVAKGTHGTPPSTMGTDWAHFTFSNQTTGNQTVSGRPSSGAIFSLCFAPWDASILDVSLSSTSNRTEPLMQWWDSFKTSAVVDHLLPHREHRQILRMAKPQSLLGDLPPTHERPIVQSDASGSSAAEYGSNTPLPGNWSIFLTGEPMITLLNNFSRSPNRAIAADPALAAIFTDTMTATGSVAWAVSSLITVLSMSNYYSQLPAFDRLDNVTVSKYVDVLYPRQHLGLVLVLWALVAHYAIVAALVVAFVRKTRFTRLGDAWAAFAQMAESQDVKAYTSAASLGGHDGIVKGLRAGKNLNLRARIVRRGDAAEIVVQ